MKNENLTSEQLASAEQVGRQINSACFNAARKKSSGNTIYKEKDKAILAFTGSIKSAKTPHDLTNRLTGQILRHNSPENRPLNNEGMPFIRAILTGEVELTVAKELICTFASIDWRDNTKQKQST